MKRHLKFRTAVVLVFTALAFGGPGASAEGVRYEPAGGGFSVWFPAAPEKRSDQANLGAFVLSISAYGLDHEGMSFFVTHFGGLPPEAMSDPRMEDIFYQRMENEYAMLGASADRNAFSIAARSDISLAGFKGRQLVLNGSASMGVVRGYKAGQRFYVVGVLGSKEDFSAPRAVAFLDSFKFTSRNK